MQNVQDVVALEFEKHGRRLDSLELLNDELSKQNALIAQLAGKLNDQGATIDEMRDDKERMERKLEKVVSENKGKWCCRRYNSVHVVFL